MRGMFRFSFRQHLMAGAAIVAVASASPAQAQTKSFDVAPQPAAQGIPAFAKQAGIQIIASGNVVRDRRTNAVHCTCSVEEALRALLSGSGLAVGPRGETGILTIVSAEGNAGAAEAAASSGEVATANETITVTGTRIIGVKPISPVRTITSKDLIDQGYTRVDDALQSLTNNFNGGATPQANPTIAAGPDSIYNGTYASSVNLYGLGAGTTLTLLNGEPMAPTGNGTRVDISGIPVSVLDRIEILEDGGSALYGTNAVGGVVNFITKKNFSGLEAGTRLTGIADGKKANYGAYLLGGYDWGTGNITADVDYEKDYPLFGSARPALVASDGALLGIIPANSETTIYVSGHQDIGDRLSFSAQALAPYRYFSEDSGYTIGDASYGWDRQYNASGELDYKVSTNWRLAFSGGYSTDYAKIWFNSPLDDELSLERTRFETDYGDLRLNGNLIHLPGGAVKLATGVHFERQHYRDENSFSFSSGPYISGAGTIAKRRIWSTYGEVLIPLVSDANSIPLVRELTVDAAARYDHYSDFGSTTNPKVVLRWKPTRDLILHGSVGTDFRAPEFEELFSRRFGYLFPQVYPAAPGGLAPALLFDGGNPNLRPEKARSLNIGAEWKPVVAPGLDLILNYFSFNYTNRIERVSDQFPFTSYITNASQLGSLIELNPTLAEVNAGIASVDPNNFFNYGIFFQGAPYTASQVVAIANVAFNNTAKSLVRGLTPRILYETNSQIGRLSADLDSTIFLKYRNSVTPVSTPFSILNTFANPLKFRAKANFGWFSHGFGANVRVNYANAYHNAGDPNCPAAPGCRVSSWTTVDLGLSYSSPDQPRGGWTSGWRFGANVSNLFNTRPPFAFAFASITSIFYDPVNGNPLGRAFSITATKRLR